MTIMVGLISPGAMGSAVGAAVTAPATQVVWASHGRSDASRERAALAGLDAVRDVAELAATSDVVVSVCPPHAAVEVAEQVAAEGFRGLYVDANAVAPQTARTIGASVASVGATYVDGGIVGPPPTMSGTTRLYLAGEEASAIAELFADGALEAVVLRGGAPAASALKMAYAGWTKGSGALLLAMRALAAANGVEDDLVAEWARSQPGLAARSDHAAASGAAKAWRWVGEMDEVAASLHTVGLPEGFHAAAAEIFGRMAHLRQTDGPTEVGHAIAALFDVEVAR